MPDKEISVSAKGVSIKGEVVDDVRPVVRRLVKTSDSILRLLDNVVGLPVDYVSNNLERFRQKYAARFEEIPPADRQEPPMRIGCAVIKNAAYSADEPDIQDLFANLLAAASNSKTVQNVHPGFATIINELRAVDAVVLRHAAEVLDSGRLRPLNMRPADVSPEEYSQAISNLVRLGLVEWRTGGYDANELQKLAPRTYRYDRVEHGERLLVELVNDFQKMKIELIKKLGAAPRNQNLKVTSFGRHFISAVTVRSENNSPDM